LNVGFKILTLVSKYIPFVINESLTNFSGFSHGFYRFFLAEPQAILAIALMLTIFNLYEICMPTYKCILAGVLLGLLFGVEATNGIMLMLWFICMSLYYVIMHKQDRFRIVLKHIISLMCAVLVYVVLFSIEMFSFSTGKGALQLSPNWFALKTGVAYFPIVYGPPFILGMAGLFHVFKRKETYSHWVFSYVVLLCIGISFTLFIQNPTEYHFGLLKATRIIPISLLMLSVYYLQDHFNINRTRKGIIIITLMAFPTIITDNIIASNISNPSTFVRIADMDAARWIKGSLPQGAIVQAEPNYPGIDDNGISPKYAYSFVPIFAQRRTAIGEWKVSSQEHRSPEEVSVRFRAIKSMFSTHNLKECMDIINKYDIDYIYVGSLEKHLYGDGINKFDYSGLFDVVYSSDGVKIYKVISITTS
jgi:hypothetical protein